MLGPHGGGTLKLLCWPPGIMCATTAITMHAMANTVKALMLDVFKACLAHVMAASCFCRWLLRCSCSCLAVLMKLRICASRTSALVREVLALVREVLAIVREVLCASVFVREVLCGSRCVLCAWVPWFC